MISQYKIHFANLLKLHTNLVLEDIISLIETPPDNIPGDLAFPCFKLSKELKKSPNIVAQEIIGQIQKGNKSDLNSFFEKFEVAGPYINAFITIDGLASDVLTNILEQKQNYGIGEPKNETIVVESPGPNTNKPLHIGHVRNILLGNSLTNILKFAGYKVHRVDIINDRGIHICKSMLAYKKFGNNSQPDKKTDHFVGDRYVRYAQELEKHPEMEQEVKEMLIKREDGDQETISLRKKMNKRAIDGQAETYKRFGTIIDKAYLESDHYLKGKDIVMDFFRKGTFTKDEKGNIVFQSKDETLGQKAVLRSDGTSIYSTQDIGLAQLRYDDFQMDRMIHIVGSEQEEYFRVLFEIFTALGFKFADKCHHLSYGMISIPGGKMKSREGTVVDADNLVDELQNTAKDQIKKRYPDISDNELSTRAESIALGSIKFFMLKYDTNKSFVFDPQESLSFEGETGPYVQYSYARTCAIIKKSNNIKIDKDNLHIDRLSTDEEKKIILKLAEFNQAIEISANEYKPSIMIRYTLELCKIFNNFYQKHKVFGDDKELENSRLILIKCINQVLNNSFHILGIDPIDEM